ncbi:archease [Halodesulfurarchaeum sp. HSR-GB]|uniref:archease n=1 Tax=Halodesulfurarchaeum sp. HSR-GB TaxID=3074077 RepID=UPI00285C88EF|nr:archease [Halodesulfurarchaeum sp. HSR-GB]MDR5655619.1 archease [Halodesulfurarchaeum sp. HSR-GB]
MGMDSHAGDGQPASGEFELRSHTADVAVEATGDSISAVFGATAEGLAAAHVDTLPEDGGSTHEFSVTAESQTALLFDYLDRLIYLRDVENVLPVDNEARVTEANGEWQVEARFRGVPLESITAREVKAATYSEMDLSQQHGRWHAYVVLDV